MHCKYMGKCKAMLAKAGFSNVWKLVPTVFNAWGIDLVSPMLQMLRHALAHDVGDMDSKFIFVSDSALPLKPYSYIRDELAKYPRSSDFCIYADMPLSPFNTYQWPQAKGLPNKPKAIKASQWSVP